MACKALFFVPAIAVFTDGEKMDSKDAMDNITALVNSSNDVSLFFFVSVAGEPEREWLGRRMVGVAGDEDGASVWGGGWWEWLGRMVRWLGRRMVGVAWRRMMGVAGEEDDGSGWGG